MSDILADSIDGLIVNEFAILLYQSNKYHSLIGTIESLTKKNKAIVIPLLFKNNKTLLKKLFKYWFVREDALSSIKRIDEAMVDVIKYFNINEDYDNKIITEQYEMYERQLNIN
jgi:hypothetical protein